MPIALKHQGRRDSGEFARSRADQWLQDDDNKILNDENALKNRIS
jgi:hypothetical protein